MARSTLRAIVLPWLNSSSVGHTHTETHAETHTDMIMGKGLVGSRVDEGGGERQRGWRVIRKQLCFILVLIFYKQQITNSKRFIISGNFKCVSV